MRFAKARLPALVDAINAAGYGLTHGIQSASTRLSQHRGGAIRAGNVYVNRNIIGAMVGVQPFGGEGLSGTGPKAGGPHYLWRLVRERVPRARAAPEALPGPTGESNVLSLHARGRVACIAPTPAERAAQVKLAESLGNTAVAKLSPRPDAVLFAGTEVEAAKIRAALAQGDGPLVPVIVGRDGAYDAARLVSERTLTVNTTASGGNASLLSLEEDETA